MNYMVCIDDTDMPGTRGTGWLVEDLCNILAAEKLAAASAISRHQPGGGGGFGRYRAAAFGK
jgi:hypothetical protein